MNKKDNRQHSYIEIAGREIGPDYPCFIIAEISANHHQKYKEAVKLIKAAAESGADAVKLQTYTPDTMTIDSHKKWFIVKGQKTPNIWRGKTLYDLYKTAHTPWEWQPKLKKLAEELGLIFFSTPFDETAVDFLKKINVPCYKISSYETLDIPLLRKISRTKKPIIISQGFYPKEDVDFSLKTLKKAGAKQIAILYCVSQYVANPKLEDLNLATMIDIAERFGVVVGFSDNNAGIEIPVIAATMGASIVEKHFILDRNSDGPDARFSIEPHEFKQMVYSIRRIEKAKGKVHYTPSGKEANEIKKFCRSLFVVKDIKKEEKLTPKNVRSIRPAAGLSPKFWDQVIGKRASRDIQAGAPLSWKMIAK